MTDQPNIVSLRNGRTFTPSNPTNTPRQEVISLLEDIIQKLKLGDEDHYEDAASCIVVMLSDHTKRESSSLGVLSCGLNGAEVIGELHAAAHMLLCGT